MNIELIKKKYGAYKEPDVYTRLRIKTLVVFKICQAATSARLCNLRTLNEKAHVC